MFVIMYVATGLGVTVGFHRHLTHRSFKTSKPVRGLLAILGSVAIEGPVISWVADHRKHHTYSDQEGDPHSPHVGPRRRLARRAQGPRPRPRRLAVHPHPPRRAQALRARPDRRSGRSRSSTGPSWSGRSAGSRSPFGLGYAIGGTLDAALTGLLWGGGVRMLVVHHVTYSINSLCHFFGRQRFPTEDESRNLFWLALSDLR